MTTLFPDRRPQDRDKDSFLHDTTPRKCTQSRQRTPRLLPAAFGPQGLEQAIEPISKRRKIDDDERAFDRTAINWSTQSVYNLEDLKRPRTLAYQTDARNQTATPGQSSRISLYPSRPSKISSHYSACEKVRRTYKGLPIKGDVSVKPYVAEAPSSAPRYHPIGPADYLPWTGKQAEDLLSEPITRNGFYDKTQTLQNESSTAKPLLWNSLRHKSGLHVLSSLFNSALDQRQVHGRVTTASTFKPPPRVTLTDTKRESWLRDLSDPSVSLRRLSRTIPHGVRGKILLDQCLNKGVPISRAIWLTKCVGANEIRAFKRKGAGGIFTVGGEVKWIKEWTTNVEQFLEDIKNACSTTDWQAHLDYSVRLVSQLYSEKLLDCEQYLNWLLKSTAESDLENLATWLRYLEFHLQELINQRKWGRRLTELLLLQLRKAHESPSQVSYQLMIQDLSQKLQSILISAPGCFLIPDCWNKYEQLIEEHVIQEKPALRAIFDNALDRNLRLQDPITRSCGHTVQSSEQRILALFDSLSHSPNFGFVAHRSLRMIDDHGVVVEACLQWSCSQERYGLQRVYAAARLMRLWSRHGVDVQGYILGFIDARSDARGLHKPHVYKLVAELTCSKHFSVGRYLQWLVAYGSLDMCEAIGREDRCDIRLLVELPLYGLDDHIVSLRSSLLSRIGISIAEEDYDLMELKAKILWRLPHLLPQHESPRYMTSDLGSKDLGQTAKSAAARWLRRALDAGNSDPTSHNHLTESETKSVATGGLHAVLLNQDDFRTMLGIFECLGEFTILADLISCISNKVPHATLVFICDTINYHREIFVAIGAAQHLFHCLFIRAHGLQDPQPSDTALLESLVDLGDHLPTVKDEVRHLHNQLLQISPHRAMVACSLISDTMMETSQTIRPIFMDEIDHMLASGTSMDTQTIPRVFVAVTDHCEQICTDRDSLAQFTDLMSRLQSLGPKTFQPLVIAWLRDLLLASDREALDKILRPMICSRIISLRLVVDSAVSALEKLTADSSRSSLALDVLEIMANMDVGPSTNSQYRTYRARDQQQQVLQASPLSIVTIFRFAAGSEPSANGFQLCPLPIRLRSPLLISFLHTALLETAKTTGAMPLDEMTQVSFGRCFLASSGDGATHQDKTLAKLIEDVNEYNILFYQLKLQAILWTGTTRTANVNASTFARMLIKATSNNPPNRVNLWARLVSVLRLDSAKIIREQVEDALISGVSGPNATCAFYRPGCRQGLLTLVEATLFDSYNLGPSSIIERISHALSSAVSHLQRTDSIGRHSVTLAHIHTLLRLLVIHHSVFREPRNAQNMLSRIIISLCLILNNTSSPQNYLATDRDVFDVLALLSDYLTDESRTCCARTLYDRFKVICKRLSFVFGALESLESERLQLVSNSSLFEHANDRLPKDATPVRQSYGFRRWEMMPDATPVITENDASLSLCFFGARKPVF